MLQEIERSRGESTTSSSLLDNPDLMDRLVVAVSTIGFVIAWFLPAVEGVL